MKSQTIKRLVDLPPHLLKEGVKTLAVSYCRLFRSSPKFRFQGRDYSYFFHPYNLTWRNERTVEIPIAREFLSAHSGQEILEVGNVLSHYIDVHYDILDKHEVSNGVINEDALDFDPGKKYDMIISISTLEHIGWDENPREPEKAGRAMANLARLLSRGGELVATIPLGYNPDFDNLIEKGKITFSQVFAMRRLPRGNKWVEVDFDSVRGSAYEHNRFRADAIMIGLIKREG